VIGNILIRLASFSFQKCLVLSAILGGVYYMTVFDDGSALQAKIMETDAKVREEESRAQASDLALKEVEQVRATVGALSEQFKTVSQALPSEVQIADILRTVDFVSRKSGVSVKTKEPKPIINRDYYEEIPLLLVLEGSYSEITTFLFYLASTERIMKVNNFTISQPPQRDRNSPSKGRLNFEGHVVSYRFIGTQPTTAQDGVPNAASPGGQKK
jgi:Tfp pilus assembly protein PilO